MGSWKCVVAGLGLAGGVVLSAVGAVSAATDYGTGTWQWESNPWSLTFAVDKNPSLAPGMTFNFYDWDSGNAATVFGSGAAGGLGAVLLMHPTIAGTGYATNILTGKTSPPYLTASSLAMGATNSFGFSFTNGAATYYSYNLLANDNGSWLLSSMDTGMQVLVASAGISPLTDPGVPAVPIPGAALLLGCGLLGLFAMDRRRHRLPGA